MCNITREKHFKVPVLKKKTGRGGGKSNKQSTENTTNYFNQTNTQANLIFTTLDSRQNKTGKLEASITRNNQLQDFDALE